MNNPVRKFTWGLDIAEQASGLPYGDRPGAAAGGVGGLLAVEESSGSESGDYVYFYDANGNVGQVLDWDTETIAAHYEYDPFGRLISSSGGYADGNRFRFSTKYQDPITGFYYYGYRYLSTELGRFLNRDLINEAGSQLVRDVKKAGDLGEEMNLYAFVGNDPVNDFDYLGLALPGQPWPPGWEPEPGLPQPPGPPGCGGDGCSRTACSDCCEVAALACMAACLGTGKFAGACMIACGTAGFMCRRSCRDCPCP